MAERRQIETSQGPLAYLRAGSGPALVLIHGALLTADDMALALMRQLSPRYDVIAFDRPGHGDSRQTPGNEGSPYAQASMIAAGWTALGIERPVVIGHSFGATVSLCLALTVPEAVTGVVALAPLCFPEPRIEQMLFGPRALPPFGSSIATMLGPPADVLLLPLLRNAMFFPQIMPAAYADAYPFAWASGQAMMLADGKDSLATWGALMRSAALYSRCGAPIHILGGTHDIVVSNARQGYAAAQMMRNAAFEWVPGAGHMLHHFHQDSIDQAIERFITSATKAREMCWIH